MIVRSLLACFALLVLAGCGTPRTWYIDRDAPHPTADIPGAGTIEFQLIKQRDDYLRVVLTIQNTSGETLWFKPADSTSKGYGFVLVPPVGLVAIRQTGVPEVGVVVPAKGKAGLDMMWGLIPPAPTAEWAWSLEIHGLMVGDRALPSITIPMPDFTTSPGSKIRLGRDKAW